MPRFTGRLQRQQPGNFYIGARRLMASAGKPRAAQIQDDVALKANAVGPISNVACATPVPAPVQTAARRQVTLAQRFAAFTLLATVVLDHCVGWLVDNVNVEALACAV
jgi:hypothetical protein